jgi:hypothetical protein
MLLLINKRAIINQAVKLMHVGYLLLHTKFVILTGLLIRVAHGAGT